MIETNVNETLNKNYKKYLFKIITLFITLLFILFIAYALKLGLFDDKEILINYIKGMGIGAPIIFIIIQLLQVVVPIIPGNLCCLVGVLAFGPVWGFVYNYIGLVIGSCLVYYLSCGYGLKIVKRVFKEETINKYLGYVNNNSFKKIFFISIVLPGFPDDLLCYIAGISLMRFKTFISIILIGKPMALLMYSLFMNLL